MGKSKRGGAGTVYTEKPAQEKADGTVVKSWQRMPTQLLHEWSQREQRPKPFYKEQRPWDKTKFRQKVVLLDPKDKDSTLEFAPSDDSETAFVAKEHAALLALLRVQGTLPLERKLPEPYSDIWKTSAESATSKPHAKAKAKAEPKLKGAGKGKAKAQLVMDDMDIDVGTEEGWDYTDEHEHRRPGAHVQGHVPNTKVGWGCENNPRAPQTENGSLDAGDTTSVAPLRASQAYASKAEKDLAERQRREAEIVKKNRRQAMQDLKRRANMDCPILLSKKMRAELSDALGIRAEYMAADMCGDIPSEMTDEESLAFTTCLEQGFATQDCVRALMAVQQEGQSAGSAACHASDKASELGERMRQWLCLHVPEDELPEEFAAGKGQFEVHLASSHKATNDKKKSEVKAESAFESARADILMWLRGVLSSKIQSTDADALLASVEAVLMGIDPCSSDEEEAEEAGENAAVIVSSEGTEFESVGEELAERWRAVWAVRALGSDDKGETQTDLAETGIAEEDVSCTTTIHEELATSTDDIGAPSGTKRGKGQLQHRYGPWFGGGRTDSRASAGANEWFQSDAGKRMRKHRETLPAWKSHQELLTASQTHQLVLVQGETGCGKTTQVGQFVLDADSTARVVVTQPRRVAAVSVAQRVAEERGERMGDGEVGYSVRGESKWRRDRCRLLFCTNGILLRRLLGDPTSMFSEDTCTHLVIDEVHERSVEIDLLLTLLRQMLPKRPKLRVLLMSATMDVRKLASMFIGDIPILKIPGRTFPVTHAFAEEIEDELQVFCTHLLKQSRSGADADGQSRPSVQDGQPLPSLDFAFIAKAVLAAVRGQLKSAPKEGAVLVFVPGVGEIDRVAYQLQQLATKGEVYTLPLHGGLPPEQQRRCFQVAGRDGPRKIVISTNVAETSVTVPDVTVVIDTARERRLVLDPGAVAPCLAERICARSSLTQRKGRAGRVCSGLCVTLLQQKTFESLPKETPPEIEAAALETVCLQICVAGFNPTSFLADAPTPPLPERIEKAMGLLLRMGALCPTTNDCSSSADQCGRKDQQSAGMQDAQSSPPNVCALGRHIAALPCDVQTGKLLVAGAFMGVAGASLDIAAMLSVRSPLRNTAKDAEAQAFRERMRRSLRPGGTRSDHCLLAKLLQMWQQGAGAERRDLCHKAALVYERMAEAASVRSQLLAGLSGLGFDVSAVGDNRNKNDWRALRAAVCAGYYPQIAKVERPPPEFVDGLTGAIQKQAEAKSFRYFIHTRLTGESRSQASTSTSFPSDGTIWRREDRHRAFLHPGSVLFKETSYSCPYVVFSNLQLQESRDPKYPARLNLSEATEASVFALLLFGGQLQVRHSSNEVTIDGCVTFTGGNTTVVALVDKLRSKIDSLLMQKVEDPQFKLSDSHVAQTLGLLLSTDGMG